jgi:hypothetical protein
VHFLARLDAELLGQVGAGAHGPPVEVARAGRHAAGSHVVGEGGELQRQLDLGPGDEGALARHPVQPAFGDQVVDGLPHGHPGQGEALAELALGRDGRADAELVAVDEIEQDLAELEVLGHRTVRIDVRHGSSPRSDLGNRLWFVLV